MIIPRSTTQAAAGAIGASGELDPSTTQAAAGAQPQTDWSQSPSAIGAPSASPAQINIPAFGEEHKQVETIGERVDDNGVTLKTVVCPECGNSIEMAEGCFICLNCGYSGCS